MHRHHRYVNSPFELEDRRQFHPGKILHDVKHGLFIRRAALDVSIAFFARQHDQTEGFNFHPERFVIHRLKPFHNVVYVVEFHNDLILSDQIPPMQILPENRGDV